MKKIQDRTLESFSLNEYTLIMESETMVNTLYVSDLDGTLLTSQEKTSDFTNQTITDIVNKGMLFSYATARSYHTALKVTKGLDAHIPLIVYNGALIVDSYDGKVMRANYFQNHEVQEIVDHLMTHDVYPIVYSFIDQVEKFSFVEEYISSGIQDFLQTRKGDKRTNAIDDIKDLTKGDCFYITCIDEKEKLEPLYQRYQEKYHCVFQKDIYLHSQWLEIMPPNASKSCAIQQLKEILNCQRLIVFGDGVNDIDMFEIADEAYAVDNAVDQLKEIATDVILDHDQDGVAHWLKENVKIEEINNDLLNRGLSWRLSKNE